MKKFGLMLGIINTVAIAALLGLFVYTKLIFKPPPITEMKERERLMQTGHKAGPDNDAKKFMVVLEPISTNLDPYVEDGKEKNHFVSMTVAVELRGEEDVEKFTAVKAVIMDKIIQNLGKKKFEDLNQVQGRYVFRSQIIDAANEYLKAPIVNDVYFSDFLLQ